MKMCLLVYPWFSLFVLVSTEVITLIKENNMTCVVTGGSMDGDISISNYTHIVQLLKTSSIDVSDFLEMDQQDTDLKSASVDKIDTTIFGLDYNRLTMLVSTDVGCYLNVTLAGYKMELANKIIYFTSEKFASKWKEINVQFNPTRARMLYFHPGSNNASRICNFNISNITNWRQTYDIYHRTTPKSCLTNKCFCKTGTSLKDTKHPLINCNSPYIGINCTIMCSDILGASFPKCESHRICVEDTCYCAWGFEEPNCNQKCQKGLNCAKSLNENGQTSTDNESMGFLLEIAIIAICAVCVILLSLACYTLLRKKYLKNSTSHNDDRISINELRTLAEQDSTLTEYSPQKEINISNLEQYLISTQEDPANNELSRQYEVFSRNMNNESGFEKSSAGKLNKNIKKNRYRNILPYDKTRVKLLKHKPGDYINANYIDGYKKPKAFIATQAPLESTKEDFWTMIWQQNVKTIIMLTKLNEQGNVKSIIYWPEDDSILSVGKFFISNTASESKSYFIQRNFKLKFDNQIRTVQHYQYVDWPDHRMPTSPRNFTTFVRKITQELQNSPIVVHCSAGCGRTGTFMLCLIALNTAIETKKVNFFKILNEIRQQRMFMVDGAEQYIFAHRFVWQHFFEKDFSIRIDRNFESQVQKALEANSLSQLSERLATTKLVEKALYEGRQLTDDEKAKNRFSDIVPTNDEIRLPPNDFSIESNYINAVFVNCYNHTNKFIVTQQPMPKTLTDFWRLVQDNRIDTIVSLNKIDETDPTCVKFWPSEDEIWDIEMHNALSLTSLNTDNDVFDTIELKIANKTVESLERTVTLIDVKRWKHGSNTLSSVKDLIQVWKAIRGCNDQIIVTCYDGATASGLFVAMNFVLEKMNQEFNCDIYSAVKEVRLNRMQFIDHPEQLQFLYEASIEYARHLYST